MGDNPRELAFCLAPFGLWFKLKLSQGSQIHVPRVVPPAYDLPCDGFMARACFESEDMANLVLKLQ